MKTSFSVSLKFGVLIAVALVVYFFILRSFSLHQNPLLRLFNGIVMAAGIYYAIKYFKKSNSNAIGYFDGFKTGLFTGFIATIIFTAFMSIYMFHLDPNFTKVLMREWFSTYNQGAGVLVFIILIEGLSSTVVLTLAFMQLFKKSRNIS